MSKKRDPNDSAGVKSALQYDDDERPEEKKNKKPEQEIEQKSKDRTCQGDPCTCTCTCNCTCCHCSSKPSRRRAESPRHAEEGDLMSFPHSASSSAGTESQKHAEEDKSKRLSFSKTSSDGAESQRPKSPKLWSVSASSSGGVSASSSGGVSASSSGGVSASSSGGVSASSSGGGESRGYAKCSSHSKPSSSSKFAEEDEPMSVEEEDVPSSCCKLDDLKLLPQCDQNLGSPDLRMHTVLIDMVALKSGAVIPHEGKNQWDSHCVKMPCSPESLFTKSGFSKKPVRRWDEISKHLASLAKKTEANVKDVEEVIIKYNPKYKDEWKFDALYEFDRRVPKSEKYHHTLFPKIAKLALKLPEEVKKAIPLLRSGRSAAITLSQGQIACLLANAFFCTFPHRNTTSPKAEYHGFPSINFSSLFGHASHRKTEKLRAIMHYFREVTDDKTDLSGLVTFERRCDMDGHNWDRCKETMPKLHVTSQGAIEREGTGMLQVDFACSWIGGGVLNSGLVQEEVLFVINPELIVSRLFTERLNNNECLIITGTRQFSRYSGFGDTFEWTGPHEDKLEKDEWRRLQRKILAIDALHFKYWSEQYDMYKVKRELNKAYCGFKGHDDEPDIATGKWGCGAFNGDPQLKAVIQLMAAAKARRGLAFFTFGDDRLKDGLERIYSLLDKERITVERLYRFLEDFCDDRRSPHGSRLELFDFIRKKIKHSRSRM